MIDDRPAFPRGTLAYQPHSFGWILAEVVRRVSGQPLDEFLARTLPPSLSGLRLRYDGEAAETYWQGARPHLLAGFDLSAEFEHANNRRLPTSQTPIAASPIYCVAALPSPAPRGLSLASRGSGPARCGVAFRRAAGSLAADTTMRGRLGALFPVSDSVPWPGVPTESAGVLDCPQPRRSGTRCLAAGRFRAAHPVR